MTEQQISFTCICGEPLTATLPAAGAIECSKCHAEIALDPQSLDDAVPLAAPELRSVCEGCGAPLDLDEAERRGQAFVICDYCGQQFDRNDSRVLSWGEPVLESVEMTRLEVPVGHPTPHLWAIDGKSFKTFAAFERYLRSQYPAAIADQMIAAMR